MYRCPLVTNLWTRPELLIMLSTAPSCRRSSSLRCTQRPSSCGTCTTEYPSMSCSAFTISMLYLYSHSSPSRSSTVWFIPAWKTTSTLTTISSYMARAAGCCGMRSAMPLSGLRGHLSQKSLPQMSLFFQKQATLTASIVEAAGHLFLSATSA